MSGPEDVERPAEPLPPWQADRLAILLDALAGVPISDAERRTLTWVCGFETHTVEHLVAVIDRAQAVAMSKQVARDHLETERLRRRLSETDALLAEYRDEVISRHREADQHRGQLVDLCLRAGIDPGKDPAAALLTHLGGREPGGGRSS